LKTSKICIVIPTYNERENIASIIGETLKVASENGLNLEILVVDDNSPDGTGDLVEEISRREPRVHLLKRPGKQGLGSAYKAGFATAIKKLNAEVLVEMDADGSHDPAYLPALIGKIFDGYDVVVGSRYIPGGSIVGWGVKRKIISKTANWLARQICGIKIKDATSGYRAIRSEIVKRIGLEKTSSSGFSFQVEFLFLAEKAGFKIAETPIKFVDRVKAKSKLNWREIVGFALRCVEMGLKRF
jgi:glycosyltransferase involved in cell wall biosynthesis